MPGTVRPTYVDKEKYLNFVNECRVQSIDIRETLNNLLFLYTNNGQVCFSGVKGIAVSKTIIVKP